MEERVKYLILILKEEVLLRAEIEFKGQKRTDSFTLTMPELREKERSGLEKQSDGVCRLHGEETHSVCTPASLSLLWTLLSLWPGEPGWIQGLISVLWALCVENTDVDVVEAEAEVGRLV